MSSPGGDRHRLTGDTEPPLKSHVPVRGRDRHMTRNADERGTHPSVRGNSDASRAAVTLQLYACISGYRPVDYVFVSELADTNGAPNHAVQCFNSSPLIALREVIGGRVVERIIIETPSPNYCDGSARMRMPDVTRMPSLTTMPAASLPRAAGVRSSARGSRCSLRDANVADEMNKVLTAASAAMVTTDRRTGSSTRYAAQNYHVANSQIAKVLLTVNLRGRVKDQNVRVKLEHQP
jgi:hypothetical protein